MNNLTEIDFFVVGLQNPKNEHKNTRHNAGAMALRYIAESFGFEEFEELEKTDALVSKGRFLGKNFIFILPQTYMNKSGKAVLKFLNKEVAQEKLIVLQDDVDIPFGSVKRKDKGGAGGHNGVADIIKKLGTDEFQRIKIGIAKINERGEAFKFKNEKKTADFVLQKFSFFEKRKLKKEIFKKAEGLLTDIIKNTKSQ